MPIELVSGNQKKVDHTPSVNVTAGTAVLFGSSITIASIDLPANRLGAVNWPNGSAEYTIPNTDGLVFGLGVNVFIDIGNDKGLLAGGDGKGGVTTVAVLATDPLIRFIHEK